MKPWARYEELKAELARLNYNVREQIIDASYYGVAQRRKRLFMIADLIEEPPFILPPDGEIKTVWSILDRSGKYKMTPLRTPRRAAGTLARADRAIKELGPNESFIIVYYGSDGSGGWQRMDAPLRTITTVDRFAFVTPTENGHMMRMLQPEELRKAMGFPDHYKFPDVSRRERVKLMGNAVCSPVMEAIVSLLKKRLLDTEHSNEAA